MSTPPRRPGVPPAVPPTEPLGPGGAYNDPYTEDPRFARAPSGYPPQPGGYDDGPGIGERAQEVAHRVARHVKTPETKEFYKSSEFLVWALGSLMVLIAAAVISGNGATPDVFTGDEAWRYVTILTAAYIVSRGISKAGTRRGRDRDDRYGDTY
jgi:hypothetical protein